jgi:hypothetical protein
LRQPAAGCAAEDLDPNQPNLLISQPIRPRRRNRCIQKRSAPF